MLVTRFRTDTKRQVGKFSTFLGRRKKIWTA
jgi:hypothetical protein